MEDERRRQLETRLQSILGELSEVCAELGIEPLAPEQRSGGDLPAAATAAGATGLEREGDAGPLLLTRVDRLTLGFVAREVLELVRMVALSDPVEPRPELEGFVNVRGQAVPVLDLRHLLDLDPVEHGLDQSLILLQAEHGRVAVVVDDVLDIYDLSPDAFQDREALELRRGFIDGVARVEERLVAVINPVLLARAAL